MFDSLDTALKELAEVDAGALSDEELDEAVVGIARRRAALEAREAEMLSCWQARKSWRADNSRSAQTWLARRTRAPKTDCGSRLRLAQMLLEMPLVAAAFAAGDIDKAHVRRLASALNERTRDAFVRDEALLLHWAQSRTFLEFSIEVEMWLMEEDPDGTSQKAQDQRDRRDAWLAESFGGMWLGKMTLDPVSGQIVSDELLRLEEELFDADWREARERLDREPKLTELRRSPAQRRADALVEMARRSARPKAGSAPRPLFTLALGRKGFERACRLASGQMIDPTAILDHLDDAQIQSLLFDSDVAIEASRKRFFSGILRRIIEVRDGFCACGCGEPAERCQIDHLRPHSRGGMTCQCNGGAKCAPTNRRKGDRQGPPLP